MMIRWSVLVLGEVQGVGYRYFVKRIADSLNVFGQVKNRLDGSVEIVAEGNENAVDKFIEICKKGSPHSKIERVVINQEEFKGEFKDFQIKSFRPIL
jgi:acylphosphatase